MLRTMRKQWRIVVDGDRTFLTIGAVANALHRDVGTVRRFERQGLLPQARYRLSSGSPSGERRLYTREQVERLELAALASGFAESQRAAAEQLEHFRRLAHRVMAEVPATAPSASADPGAAPGLHGRSDGR